MEWNMFSALNEWAPEGKQNFTFGAKTSSCLPSAYSQDVLASAGIDLLPEWDQSSLAALGDHVELFDGTALSTEAFDAASVHQSNFFNAHMDADDADLLRTMKTEDMMIPLSEMVDEELHMPQMTNSDGNDFQFFDAPTVPSSVNAPLQFSIQPSSPPPPPPQKRKKITITVRTVKKPCIAPPVKVEKFSPQPLTIQPFDNQLSQLSETDVLLDELVRMVEKEDGGCDFLNIDSAVVEESMNDLLAHLEDSSKTQGVAVKAEVASPSATYAAAAIPGTSQTNYVMEDSYYPTDTESAASSPRSTVDTSVIDSVANSPMSSVDQFSSSEEMMEDPEYTMDSCHTYTRKKAPRGRRPNALKPYPECRKERKKEQNKQAALRYRQKKKQEEDDFMGKIRAEEDRKKELTKQYNNIKQELSCMKKIMREVFVAKGLISADAFKKLEK